METDRPSQSQSAATMEIASAGVMTEPEVRASADKLLEDSEAGIFFGPSNYYGYVARRARLDSP
jgi:hypothetical protein